MCMKSFFAGECVCHEHYYDIKCALTIRVPPRHIGISDLKTENVRLHRYLVSVKVKRLYPLINKAGVETTLQTEDCSANNIH